MFETISKSEIMKNLDDFEAKKSQNLEHFQTKSNFFHKIEVSTFFSVFIEKIFVQDFEGNLL